jgi:hypothetical protein
MSAAAGLMHIFRAWPVPDRRRRPWRLAADKLYNLLNVQNSLVAGKNAGNFADSAFFRGNPSRKHLRIQALAREFRKRGKTPGERGFSVGLLVRRIEICGRGIPESAIV